MNGQRQSNGNAGMDLTIGHVATVYDIFSDAQAVGCVLSEPDVVIIHLSFRWRKLAEPFRALSIIAGVEQVKVFSYRIEIEKGKSFSWGHIMPSVMAIIRKEKGK